MINISWICIYWHASGGISISNKRWETQQKVVENIEGKLAVQNISIIHSRPEADKL
ncbi:hypothetical protein [Bacillus sp. OV322]|uniref:hypothetical protein n=1 Tax=Bacillus sp. OV322 TaxID=1882764 RepID=UPI0015A68302|nr:hypothetical protein [Bacillus sp. OV322]